MTKKRYIAVIVLALVMVFTSLLCLLLPSTAYAASADAIEQSEQTNADEQDETTPETAPTESEGETATNAAANLSDSVKAFLKSVYGDDYEKYYDDIIAKYGTVEKFMLEAAEYVPEKYKYKFTELITQSSAYITIGADALLLICAGAYLIAKAKKDKNIKAKLDSIIAGLNQVQVGELAIMGGQQAQNATLKALTPGEQFADANAELTASDEQLATATKEIKRDV